MDENKITAVVLTKNEAENLPRCLKSLCWVEEIVVVDDFSSDKTVGIAKKFGAKIYKKKLSDFQSQRDWALGKVKTPWVLFIDPDEEVPQNLKEEMRMAVKRKGFVGFQFPRKNIIFGKWIKYSGWYPDWQLHLFKKDKGKYIGKVHERVEVGGKAGYLKSPLIHYNYQSISEYLEKLEHYTTLAAESAIEGGYKFKFQDLLRKPAEEFFRRFFAEEGFRDEVHGLALSLLQAFSELVLYLKVWEKQGFKTRELPFADFLPEMEKLGKETTYWLTTTLIKETKNPVRKIFLKLRRKQCLGSK